jgi:hypothetical protein
MAPVVTNQSPVPTLLAPSSQPALYEIASSPCLKTLDLAKSHFNARAITTLFVDRIAASRIERIHLPQFMDEKGMQAPYAFSNEQTASILGAVQSNPCLLECVPAGDPLPIDLAASIHNITKTRTPCQPDPACNVSLASPPKPTPIFPDWVGGVAGGIAVLVTCALALGVYFSRKCCWGSSGETEHLLRTDMWQIVPPEND